MFGPAPAASGATIPVKHRKGLDYSATVQALREALELVEAEQGSAKGAA